MDKLGPMIKDGLEPDIALALFLKAMRYLAEFMPILEPEKECFIVPFGVKVVYELDTLQ